MAVDRPEWTRNLTCLWQSDDARPPDAESIREAWQRYFGEELPNNKAALALLDQGDAFYYRHKNGIACFACDGQTIYVEPGSPWYDWTIDTATGRSNSSKDFVAIVNAIHSLLRDGAAGAVLSRQWTEGKAVLIAAHLAHVHSLRPVKPPERKFKEMA